ncbi:helix-turn-helix domain-containing protein [Niameybacter massiliensis]|uniref:helix-turn-helix domain-containing protein n=1 Tax=Niameybacter massiliensis TaxID=1658108 RepID=UPI0006B646BE|nr:helix-turn-helix transcriptional regulator [Niameybacter massiliensis]
MNIKLGEKIKYLRKKKNISQEILANYLGISFQAVSKWENGATMPDVCLIPALASFFGVSTDELFDFNLYEIENNVNDIVLKSSEYYYCDPEMCEKILREGLKKYPGNDILLNCIIGVIPIPERSSEVIDMCQILIECTKHDDIKYDAYRILAEAYKSIGEYSLAKATINKIPEIYFTKLEVAALLLDGEDMYEAAHKQKNLSADSLIEMLIKLADFYNQAGEKEKSKTQLLIVKKVIDAFKDDFTAEFFKSTIYETRKDFLKDIETKIDLLN